MDQKSIIQRISFYGLFYLRFMGRHHQSVRRNIEKEMVHACISHHDDTDDILTASLTFPGRLPEQMIYRFSGTAA